MNRKFVAIRSDGGDNRSPKGTEANSILFSVYATDVLNGTGFEHVIQSAGYGRVPEMAPIGTVMIN